VKGFIGTANIDTNSRLCMASSVAGHKRAFGADIVPGMYADLEEADLVVLTGSNLAWCHPVLFQRLSDAREKRGTQIVVIDPRRTATCEIADLHLPIAPGADVALFNGLLAHLSAAGRLDKDYIDRHTNGFESALAVTAGLGLAEIASVTGLTSGAIADFYELFAATERTVTVYSQGVNQSSAGTDKVNAIVNCHLATGRIGKPGMGPFSVTGQPNAMGGREVGGLANMLAAHMELDNPEHRRAVQEFWRSPRIADRHGLKAVDMFRAVARGRIKAIWIIGTNPVDSLPEADGVRTALAACPFVAVSDVVRHTDTTALAHVLLPAAAWGEKDGTVTNSERRISRQRAFLPLPGEARPDWWQITEVARRMGFAEAFGYRGAAEIFAEYARLTGLANDGARGLDLSGLADVTPAGYDSLDPFQWPRKGRATAETRFFAQGGFFTPDRRARFVATPWRAPASATSADFPLALNTGRIRDQWHTMTRTAKTPRLMSHIAEPFLEIHPDDAAMCGLGSAMIAETESRHGRALLRVTVTDRQQRGTVFAPMHWTDQLASCSRIDALMVANTDPLSGQPELKFTPVRVRPFEAAWYAFLVTTLRPEVSRFDYAALAPAPGGFRMEFAGAQIEDDWDGAAAQMLLTPGGELLAYHDSAAGDYRYAALDGGRCIGLLFVARAPVAVSRNWAVDQLGAECEANARLRLLAGRPGGQTRDRGAIVCSCFGVGANDIVSAIVDKGCGSVAAIGAQLGAGTNCGSCRAEISRFLHEARIARAS
jgi:assimilatory nitrate reductase catalytic subunit